MAPFDEAFIVTGDTTNIHRIWCAFKCDNCGALSIATTQRSNNSSSARIDPTAFIDQVATPEWYPIRAIGKDFPDVPQHIAEAASEAYKCLGVSAFRAAVQLARSVVEATAKEKGITQGTLISKIDELFNQRLIREHVRDGAHEIRYLGNEMAHGDFIDAVTSEETDLVLILMSEILEEIFQSPARVAKAQTARAMKKASLAAQQQSPSTNQNPV
jgi:hypothetical protein